MQYWDLKIFLPLIFLICIIGMIFLCWKEKLQKSSYLWILQIIFFWISAGFIGDKLQSKYENISQSNFIILMFFSTTLFLIFLKPLATFISGLLKNRKILIQISSYIMILLLCLTFLKSIPLWAFILLTLLLSFCLSTSTLFYLFLNEQCFYRIYILPSVWMTTAFISFSTTFGNYLSQLNLIFEKNKFELNISLVVILTLLLISGFTLSFFTKENKNMVQSFDKEILENLPTKNNKVFFIIYLLAFILCITSALNNSLLMELCIALNLVKHNITEQNVYLWLRFNDYLYLLSTFFASVVIYKFLSKIIEQKYLIFINLFLLFGSYIVLTFVFNPFIIIAASFVAGLCFNQVIYALFSTALFWNYRVKNCPITGFYSSSMFGAYFLGDTIQNIIANKKIGVFKVFSNLDELFEFKNNYNVNSLEFKNVLTKYNDLTTIVMSITCVLVLLAIIIFYFSSNKIFADYLKYKNAIQNLKVLIKKRVITKTKTKINIETGVEDIDEHIEIRKQKY